MAKPQKKSEVDLLDRKILEILKENANTSFAEIGERIGRTEATVRRRVKRMTKEGVIKKFTIVVDRSKIDNPTKATIEIDPELSKIKQIVAELKNIKEITDIWRLSGDCGLFVRVEIPSLEYVNSLVEDQISQIPGVNVKKICFVTKEIKTSFN
jgi:DNA-binding Lrp family transcriptional regulator